MNEIYTRELLIEYTNRCLAFGIDTSDCGFLYHIDKEGKYILDKYTGSDSEVYLNDMFDIVTSSAFSCSTVKSIDFGDVKLISSCTCLNCQDLQYIKALKCKSILQDAFRDCFRLKQVVFSCVENIGSGCFYNCISMHEISGLNNVIKLGADSFKLCVNLKSIQLPKLKQLERNVFNNCHNLKEIMIDSVTSIEKRALSNCYNIEYLAIPKVEYLGIVSLYGDISLHTLVIGNNFEDGFLNLKDLKKLKKIIFKGKQKEMNTIKEMFENAGFSLEWEIMGV